MPIEQNYPIAFPGLHLVFNVQNIAFSIGPIQIRWYGILIALGLLLALFYAFKRIKDFKITLDDLTDVVLVSTIFAVIGARLYYCLFFIDSSGAHPYLANLNGLKSILFIWDGGLAFYGAVIGAFVSALITCKIKKLNPLPVFDIAALGFLIGQTIGRWGNFFNREAFGDITTLPWRMTFDYTGVGVHPCFLYESLWCALGFVLLHFYSKQRKFNGEIFLMYLGWNGLGRFFIEGLRSDSLLLFGNLKVSQLLAGIMFVLATAALVYIHLKIKNKVASEGYVPVYSDLISNEEEKQEDENTDKPTNKDISENTDKNADENIDKSNDKISDSKVNENKEDNAEEKTEHKSEE